MWSIHVDPIFTQMRSDSGPMLDLKSSSPSRVAMIYANFHAKFKIS